MGKLSYNKQTFIVLLATVLGFGIFETAHIAAKNMSTSAYLAIVVCAAIFCIPALVLCYLANRHKNKTFFEYSVDIAGKRAGRIFNVVFALFYTTFATLCISFFSHIVSMWILPDTSFRLICAFIVLICSYALSRGLINVIRLVSFIGTITLVIVLFVRTSMIFSGDLNNLLPLFETDVVRDGLYKAVLGVGVFFFGVGVLSVIPQQESHTKRISFSGVWGVLGAGFMLILVLASCFCVLGPLRTGIYSEAVVLSMKAFDISRITFIQKADIIFIITWTLLMLCTVCMTCFIPYMYIKTTLKGRKARLVSLGLCARFFVFSAVIPSFEIVLWLLKISVLSLGIISLFIIPVILLIISGVRRAKKD